MHTIFLPHPLIKYPVLCRISNSITLENYNFKTVVLYSIFYEQKHQHLLYFYVPAIIWWNSPIISSAGIWRMAMGKMWGGIKQNLLWGECPGQMSQHLCGRNFMGGGFVWVGNVCREPSEEEKCLHPHARLHAMAMICATLVNTQTDSFWLVILLAQLSIIYYTVEKINYLGILYNTRSLELWQKHCRAHLHNK